MFTFRRKNTRKGQEDEAQIHNSPSLPELNSQGIPWPEDLVDIAQIKQQVSDERTSQQGAAKTSFSAVDRAPISFHKPFRGSPGKPLTASQQQHNADSWRQVPHPSRKTQRRTRIPPTFNLMVVGGQGTGKTSLLRLLLETAEISPTATVDQRAALERFLHGPTKHTQSIQTACVEICESRFDRVLFSVIDTPGLDFVESRELKLERQVSSIIKYLDSQYADTMSEESKVVRENKGDQHVHLCIYMIDPSSVMTGGARRALSTIPVHKKSRSEATISQPPPAPSDDHGNEEEEDDGELTMSPVEIRVIRRLSERSNVLPVIARADSLTDETLSAVKEAVRTGLAEAGLGFGVFDPSDKATPSIKGRRNRLKKTSIAFAESEEGGEEESENGHVNGAENGDDAASDGTVSGDDGERQSRPVIKLRPSRYRPPRLSRSRSRRDIADNGSPDATDRESVANVRFSAHLIAKTDLSRLLPFALIAPGDAGRTQSRAEASSVLGSEEEQTQSTHNTSNGKGSSPGTPSRNFSYLQGPPDDMKGVFIRKFRWGTVDVLDPNHCDFAALRTAVLSTHLKILKTHTKEVLYEKYRTEKLLARRATRNISEEEKKRLLKDLGL